MSVARRSVASSAYSVAANSLSMVMRFSSSIVLARLLEPEVFGIFAFATSIVSVTQALPNFGLAGAFMHWTDESEETLRVHFTLKALFLATWAVLLGVGVAVLAPQSTRWVFWVVIGAAFVAHLTDTAQVLLIKKVLFRRLAVLQVTIVIVSTAVSIALAWNGFGIWALLVNKIIAAILQVLILYGVRPVWRPRLGWFPPIVRYFLTFGGKVFWTNVLGRALDQVDDIWTGVALGDTALGFYSRAYKFANYPRAALARPLNKVVMGTYAQLKGKRKRLSKAFSLINALMIRANFLLAGLLTLVAPEFIRLALGARWLPMLDAFRLMLVYTLLDPIKITIAQVLSTSGAPEKVIRARLIQLVIMVLGMVTLGPWLGIAGVALAVDLMLAAGICILFWEARAFVDYSLKRLFAIPTLALIFGMVAAYAAIGILGSPVSDWYTGIIKAVVFSILYAGTSLTLEREQIPTLLDVFKRLRTKELTIT